MNTKELLLKTAFACMVCDGEIAQQEIDFIKEFANKLEILSGIDLESKINEYIGQINQQGKAFLSAYLSEITAANLTEQDEIELVKTAIKTIEANNIIEYYEISFFKKIRLRLKISDKYILKELPDKEDYLLPDIIVTDDADWKVSFNNIHIIDIKQ